VWLNLGRKPTRVLLPGDEEFGRNDGIGRG
jgi:hypothetical protein